MREIVLQPGTSTEIDGVRVRAAESGVSGSLGGCSVYDPASDTFRPLVGSPASAALSEPAESVRLSNESIELLMHSVAGWVSHGDLSQALLLRGAVREAAKAIARCEAAMSPTADEGITPSSPLPSDGTRE